MIWLILLPTAILNLKERNYKRVTFWCAVLYLALSALTFYDYFVYSEMSGTFELTIRQYPVFSSALIGVSAGLIVDFLIRVRNWRKKPRSKLVGKD